MSLEQSEQKKWYALRVKARSERLIAAAARYKGFEGFVPVYRCTRRWSDRTKWIEVPLFPGYVFCRLDAKYRLPLLTIPGVLHFVGTHSYPLPIDDEEVQAIERVVDSGLRAEPWPYIQSGQRITLQGGPLIGLDGRLVNGRERFRIVVSVTPLQRSVAVEIDREWVGPSALVRALNSASPSKLNDLQ